MRIIARQAVCASDYARSGRYVYAAAVNRSLSVKVKSLRLRLGKNQAEFAEMMVPVVSQGSVSRWEKGAMPDANNLARLAELAGQSIEQFLGTSVGAEIVPINRSLKIKGAVAAGVWRDAWQWEPDVWEDYVGFAQVDAADDRRFGLRVEGDSMNLIYPHGTVLDCVSVYEPGSVLSGQRVVVVRKRYDGEMEATVKEFVMHDGKAWLWPRSTNPSFQTPIPIDGSSDDVEETAILAVVVGSYRPE